MIAVLKIRNKRIIPYSDASARVAAYRLDKKPAVAAEIAAVHQARRLESGFTLAGAIKQAEEDRCFARANKNAMAAHKSTELICRLSGFLVDRFDVVTVDLKGALTEARGRVFSVVDIRSERGHESLSASKVLTTATHPPNKDTVFGE